MPLVANLPDETLKQFVGFLDQSAPWVLLDKLLDAYDSAYAEAARSVHPTQAGFLVLEWQAILALRRTRDSVKAAVEGARIKAHEGPISEVEKAMRRQDAAFHPGMMPGVGGFS